MNQTKLFHLTRWRLATWYAAVMGTILGICGLGVYQAIADAGRVALNRELESVAGTLHDDIEPTLKQPGQLELNTQQLLSDICLAGAKCPNQMAASKRHILGAVNQSNFYYVRFFDGSGHLIAIAGVHPEELSLTLDKKLKQTLSDRDGNRYRQITLSLHTYNYIPWGYMQVGRSRDIHQTLITKSDRALASQDHS